MEVSEEAVSTAKTTSADGHDETVEDDGGRSGGVATAAPRLTPSLLASSSSSSHDDSDRKLSSPPGEFATIGAEKVVGDGADAPSPVLPGGPVQLEERTVDGEVLLGGDEEKKDDAFVVSEEVVEAPPPPSPSASVPAGETTATTVTTTTRGGADDDNSPVSAATADAGPNGDDGGGGAAAGTEMVSTPGKGGSRTEGDGRHHPGETETEEGEGDGDGDGASGRSPAEKTLALLEALDVEGGGSSSGGRDDDDDHDHHDGGGGDHPAAPDENGDDDNDSESSSESDSDDSDDDSSSSSSEDEEELDLPESPSHEGLSAYELLRLRKMARNRARLAKLGLVSGIVGSSFGATTTTATARATAANGTATTTTPSSSMVVGEEGGVVGEGSNTWVCTRVSCGRENPRSKMRCLYCHGWRNGVRNPAISSSAHTSRKSGEEGRRRRRRIVERRQLPARRSKGVSLLGSERGNHDTVELVSVRGGGGSGRVAKGSRARPPRCHSCDGCVREDCGTCQMCLDKPRFGGSYKLRQACLRRVCRRTIAWRDRTDVKKFYLRKKVGDTVQTPYGMGTVVRVVGEEEDEEEVEVDAARGEGDREATATTARSSAGIEVDAGVTSHPDGLTSQKPGDGDEAMSDRTSVKPESSAAAEATTTEPDGVDPVDEGSKGMDVEPQMLGTSTGLVAGMTPPPIQSHGVPSTVDAGTASASAGGDPMNSSSSSNSSKTSMMTSNAEPVASTTLAGPSDAPRPNATEGMSSAAPAVQPNESEEEATDDAAAAVAIVSGPGTTERIEEESNEMAVLADDTQIMSSVTTQPIPQTTEEGTSPLNNTSAMGTMKEMRVEEEAFVSTEKAAIDEATSEPAQPSATKATDAKGPDPMMTTPPTSTAAVATPPPPTTAAVKSETRKKSRRRTSMEIIITSWTMSGGSHPTLYVPPIPRPDERPKVTPLVSLVHTSRVSWGRVQDHEPTNDDGDGPGSAPTLSSNVVGGPTWTCSHPSCRAENPDVRKRCVSCLGWRGGVRWDLIGHRLVEGAVVRTLYGSGRILAVGTAMMDDSSPVTGTVVKKTEGGIDEDGADMVVGDEEKSATSSMAVSLTSWTLADGSNPTLYLPCREAIENSIMLEGRAGRTSSLEAADDDGGGPTWTCCNPDCRQVNSISKKRCRSCQGWRGGTRDVRSWASLCANCGMDGAQVRCKKCDQAFHMTCHDPPLNNGLPRGSWKCGDCKKTPYSSHGNCSVCSGDGDVVRCKRCDKLYHLWCHFPPLESIPRGCWKCTACKKVLGAFKFGKAADDTCSICGEVGEGADLVCCKVCNKGFHRACHDPPLNGVHRGKWKCETCKHLPPPKKARAPAPRNVPPPENINNADDCYVCFNGGELICCDYCDKSFHLECHIPALSEVPRGRWKCMECYATSRRKKSRCGECKACLREDCGKCVFCRDKPKFGGRNKLKKPCEKRVCLYQNFAAMAPIATPASSGKTTSEKKRPRYLSVPQAMPVSPPAKKRKKRHSAPKAEAETESSTNPRTGIDDSGEDTPIDVPKPGFACYSFELYSTLDNETPELIAPKLGCTWQQIVAENREQYGFFKLHSRFEEGTILLIPSTCDKEKVAKIAEMGPQTDGKVELCRECGVLEVEAEGGASMLSCELCGGSCHLACAHDKPSEVPQGSWFCRCCAVPKLRVKMSFDEAGDPVASIVAPDLSIDEDGGNSDDEIRYEAVPEPGFVCSDAVFYCTLKDDTAEIIASKLGCTWEELASENIDRYGKFNLSSRFKEGSLLRIPSSHDKGKVEMLKRREDRIDVCCECGIEEGQQGPLESPMLLCDGCDAACHLTCTPDQLSTVPEGEWFCRSCATPKIRVQVQSGRSGKITATIITTCADDNRSEVHDLENVLDDNSNDVDDLEKISDDESSEEYDLENVPVDDMPDPGFVCPDAIFYSTCNNDTPELLALKFGCSWQDLASANDQYGNVRRKSKFKERTLLRIPSNHDREKLEKLKQKEVGEGYIEVDNKCDDSNFGISKRKRGRPAKRKPGRPRKQDEIEFTKSVGDCSLGPPKRKPGRPRKQDRIEVHKNVDGCSLGPPKRKPGRPQKEDKIEVDKVVDDCNLGLPKRKRGRPRKHDKIEVDEGVDDCHLRPTKRLRSSPRRQGNIEVDEGVGDSNRSPSSGRFASPIGQQTQ